MRLLPFSLALVCLLQAVSAAPLPDVNVLPRLLTFEPREVGLKGFPSHLMKRTASPSDNGQPDWSKSKYIRGQPQPDWKSNHH
ncbi:hypothetical protein F5887DRAFT_30420 [Amanita rubescens]|nr:hypothetical protein F5887DRAFT_30420 [Amanita rubescens]